MSVSRAPLFQARIHGFMKTKKILSLWRWAENHGEESGPRTHFIPGEQGKLYQQQEFHLKNNFQSKDFQHFKGDNHNEYYYSRCGEIPDIPQVTGFDILWLYQRHDNKYPHEPQDNENLKIDRLRKKHEERHDRKPQSEGDDCYLLFSHPYSCIRNSVIIPEYRFLLPELNIPVENLCIASGHCQSLLVIKCIFKFVWMIIRLYTIKYTQ